MVLLQDGSESYSYVIQTEISYLLFRLSLPCVLNPSALPKFYLIFSCDESKMLQEILNSFIFSVLPQ